MSVIIPTLWRCEDILYNSLIKLQNSNSVEEVIIIDNSTTPPDLPKSLTKVVHIKEYKNTYYCPAVNKGVRLATSDFLCILNDDISVGEKNHQISLKWLSEGIGMLGLGGIYNGFQHNPEKSVKLIRVRERPYSYACLYYIHKSNWIDFPKGLKIHYGDDYQFENIKKPHFAIENPIVNSLISQTASDPVFNKIIEQDSYIYHKYYK